MTSRAVPQSTLPRRLFHEWQWLCSRPDALDQARRWPLEGPPPASLPDLLHRCGYQRPHDDDVADRLLGQLLMVAADDRLAGRVVLQRVLPGMLAIARRRGARQADGVEGGLAELVGAMWVVIRSAAVDRPRPHVAAHLLRAAEYEAFRRSHRLVHHRREVPVGELFPDDDHVIDPTAAWLDDPARRLAEVLGHGRAAGLQRDDLDLLTSLAAGERVEVLANRLGVTDRTLRARRATAVARLRQAVPAA